MYTLKLEKKRPCYHKKSIKNFGPSNSSFKKGISSDKIQTDHLTIYPEYYYPNDKEPTLLGYKTVYGLKVITSNIDQVGTILDSSIKAGANE